jgi:hypothetical protein
VTIAMRRAEGRGTRDESVLSFEFFVLSCIT